MSARKSSNTVLPPEGVRPLPGVNLLPHETLQARDVANVRRLLLLVFVGFIALSVLAGGVLALQVGDAKQARQVETDRATRLAAEEKKYAEVPSVLAQVGVLNRALSTASATDFHWKDYLDAISAVKPSDVVVVALASDAVSPTSEAPKQADSLQPVSVGTITITAYTASAEAATSWASALDAVPGLADARVETTKINDATVAGFNYSSTLTVQVTSAAYVAPFEIKVGE